MKNKSKSTFKTKYKEWIYGMHEFAKVRKIYANGLLSDDKIQLGTN